jgi:hypothetical protein
MSELAISLHAPWAWALMFAGKDVENRSTSFPRRRNGHEVTGRVWIHASVWPSRRRLVGISGIAFLGQIQQMLANFDGPDGMVPTDIVERCTKMRGHIVGSIDVYGYQMPQPNPPRSLWYVPGSLGIMVREPKPLATPVPAKGALGWWTVPADVLAQLKEASHG